MSDTPDSRVNSSRSRWANFFSFARPSTPVQALQQDRVVLGATRAPVANQATLNARKARQADRAAQGDQSLSALSMRTKAAIMQSAADEERRSKPLEQKWNQGQSPSVVPLGSQYTGSGLRTPAPAPKASPAAKVPAKKNVANGKSSAAELKARSTVKRTA